MRSRNSGIVLAGVMALAGQGLAQVPRDAGAAAGASYAEPDAATQPTGDAQQAGGPPPSNGPQGSSQLRPGEERFDRVGHAGYAGPGEGVFALSADLPAGSHAEVTALDSGRTIVVAVRGPGTSLLDLSADAARQLGVTGHPAVRVRRVTLAPSDAALLAAGKPLPPRADAPPALLAGLRKQLSARSPEPVAATSVPARLPTRPATPARAQAGARVTKPAATPARATTGLFVQVAALSSAQRAQALAGQLGGVVRPAGGLYRVQVGPYSDSAAAQRARAELARRGYADARIVPVR